MSEPTNNISEILFRYCAKETLSNSEQAVLDLWLGQSPENRTVLARLQDAGTLQSDLQKWSAMQEDTEQVWQAFLPKMKEAPVTRLHWLKYAAAVIVLIGIGAYFMISHKKKEAGLAQNNLSQPTDIAPGRAGAILTLANGTQLVLDSLGNGAIAQQNGVQIVLHNGQVTYDAANNGPTGDMTYNQMTTPKGRQFQLVLADGSKVWLNATSSIKFPANFNGKERRVEIEGEAYFEVSPLRLRSGQKMPFIVNVAGKAAVEVLGTHFNINSYANEDSIRTTLLEGSVRISATGNQQAVILKPGEQISLSHTSQLSHPIPVQTSVAWKDGVFDFNNVPLAEVMRQLERWYDIQVYYPNGIPDIHFVGKLRRNMSLADLLSALRDVEVKFTIEPGRRLVVSK